MTARQRRTRRRNDIIVVCNQMRSDSAQGQGLDPKNYDRNNLYEVIMDCCGLDYMSDPEKRLAVVAFEEGTTAAKDSPWYK